MSETYDAAIDALKREIADRMRTVNDLCKLLGREPLYPDTETNFASGSKKIRKDQWYGKGLSTAVREFLESRQNVGPAMLDEIYDALVAGGFEFEARDPAAAKPALKQSLTKNTSIFHRLPTSGAYGLAEWYPGRKAEDDKDQPSPRKRKITRLYLNKATAKRDGADSKSKKGMTLLGSVKAAIQDAKGDFTKQQIFDWIANRFPELDANRTSVFSMITHLREEMGLHTTPGIGKEPSTYRRQAVESNGQHK